ncbi:MAG TPA: Flp family type IVb pilin [Dehalococcoidia bacterium]|jgi:pilus assembly protein Flp/PilA|nr:Flp family type IVb pilin [Dehalococcoidia bacterium]
MSKVMKWIRKDEEGQGLAEYVLILSLIAVVCIAAMTSVGVELSTMLNHLAGSI